jgi:hypothetical protein
VAAGAKPPGGPVARPATVSRSFPTRRAAPAFAGAGSGPAVLLAAIDRGAFPATLYLEGPSEPFKAAILRELRAAWSTKVQNAAPARVMRAAESGVDEILASYQGGSLFATRELILVLEIEDLGKSEKRVNALAEGLERPDGESSLVLVESEAENPRKLLEPLRARCASMSCLRRVPS